MFRKSYCNRFWLTYTERVQRRQPLLHLWQGPRQPSHILALLQHSWIGFKQNHHIKPTTQHRIMSITTTRDNIVTGSIGTVAGPSSSERLRFSTILAVNLYATALRKNSAILKERLAEFHKLTCQSTSSIRIHDTPQNKYNDIIPVTWRLAVHQQE